MNVPVQHNRKWCHLVHVKERNARKFSATTQPRNDKSFDLFGDTVLPVVRQPVILFSRINCIIFGYYDPINIGLYNV